MNQPTPLYLASLIEAKWCSIEQFSFPSECAKHWLLEQGSLSRRLGEHCGHLSVEVLNNHMVDSQRLRDDELKLLSRQNCLVREVILQGDAQEWVLGRTLIPSDTLVDPQHDLSQQGEVPLGITVFSAEKVKRDALEVAQVETPHGPLLARRSRLWMNNKPMLVAELFLPNAPIYVKECQ